MITERDFDIARLETDAFIRRIYADWLSDFKGSRLNRAIQAGGNEGIQEEIGALGVAQEPSNGRQGEEAFGGVTYQR